ncbi:MAG TPA: NAD(P)/FAD-dependent oxidoreductase [Mycobacterium sp.]|nr:NAD(P)/FAD-dependent oxidoreductase [Mycobacterium sp.]
MAPASTAMPSEQLDTDYLILGAGAMGMGFADVILAEDPHARIVIVDRHASPGGHWNDAYPFVRLHQPALFYGLNSTHLGQGGEDLASYGEILGYYKNAMDRFLATDRVRFLSMSEYHPDGRIVSLVDRDRVTRVTAHRRIVDGTYMTVAAPSICPPRYTVDPDATVIPPNGLVRVGRPWERYVVIGAGKTGMDSILFLLNRGVSPTRIQWIVPNDAWLFNRAAVQPGRVLESLVAIMRSIATATNIDDVFRQAERLGVVWRIDTRLLPTKWRCAIVDAQEMAGLRQIDNVVRMGRVQRISGDQIHLDGGTIDAVENSLFIDCSANGLAKVDAQPLFSERRITLQSVFMCQQTFSAALIARLELLGISDQRRNQICSAVPHPELKQDLLNSMLTSSQNMINCHRQLPVWLPRSRLNPAHYEAPHRYLLGAGKMLLLQRRAVAAMNSMLPDEQLLNRRPA